MKVVKVIAMIFLAVYLILTGLSTMSEIQLSHFAKMWVDLIGIASGVLLLISINQFTPSHRT